MVNTLFLVNFLFKIKRKISHKKIPGNKFKKLVKENTLIAALKYLKEMQSKGKKGAAIHYNFIEHKIRRPKVHI